MSAERLVIGIGNPHRGDDAAGISVAERLGAPRAVTSAGGAELIDLWEDRREVVVVDATRSGEAAGTLTRFEAASEPLPAANFASSHSFGLAETVELARALGRLPHRLQVYGIEGAVFELGSEMTPEVRETVARLVEELEAEG